MADISPNEMQVPYCFSSTPKHAPHEKDNSRRTQHVGLQTNATESVANPRARLGLRLFKVLQRAGGGGGGLGRCSAEPKHRLEVF